MSYENDKRSWFARNWPWVVPTGGCLVIIILLVVFAGSLFVGVTSIIKNSTPYQEAIVLLNESEAAKEALGEPIETSGMMSGNINTSGNTGEADLSIPVKGPKGDGVLYVVGERRGDTWTYQRLEVVISEDNETIKLLPALPPD